MKFSTVLSLFAAVLSTAFVAIASFQYAGLRSELSKIQADIASIRASSPAQAGSVGSSLSNPSLIRGWSVRIFEAPKHRGSSFSVNGSAYAGAFIHTGSWISLDEYKKHDGIFLSGEAALNLRGEFHPKDTAHYVFAVHMKMIPEEEASVENSPTVSCYARLQGNGGREILRGKMLVDEDRLKGALIAEQAVKVRFGEHSSLDFSFVCDGKPKLDSAKILFRLCVRKVDDPSFRPLVPSLRI